MRCNLFSFEVVFITWSVFSHLVREVAVIFSPNSERVLKLLNSVIACLKHQSSDIQIETIWPYLWANFPSRPSNPSRMLNISKCLTHFVSLHCCVHRLPFLFAFCPSLLFFVPWRIACVLARSVFQRVHHWNYHFFFRYIFIIVSSSASTKVVVTVAQPFWFSLKFSVFLSVCSSLMYYCVVHTVEFRALDAFLSRSLWICSFSSCIFFFVFFVAAVVVVVAGRFDEPLFQHVPFSIDKNLALHRWKRILCVDVCVCARVGVQAFLCMCFPLTCLLHVAR